MGSTVTISNVTTVGGQLVFDWSSNLPVDLAVVKQGPGGAYWRYNPSVTSGILAAYKNGEPSGGVSHVLFCYHPGSQGGDPKLLVSKTAETHIKKTYDWSIAKKERDGKTQLNGQVDGPAGTANYEIKVTKELVSTEYSVSGVITVKNDSATNLVAATVTDTLPGRRTSCWLCPAPVPSRSQPGRRSTARTPPSCPMPMLAPTRHSPTPDPTRSRTGAARRPSRSTTRPRHRGQRLDRRERQLRHAGLDGR